FQLRRLRRSKLRHGRSHAERQTGCGREKSNTGLHPPISHVSSPEGFSVLRAFSTGRRPDDFTGATNRSPGGRMSGRGGTFRWKEDGRRTVLTARPPAIGRLLLPRLRV